MNKAQIVETLFDLLNTAEASNHFSLKVGGLESNQDEGWVGVELEDGTTFFLTVEFE